MQRPALITALGLVILATGAVADGLAVGALLESPVLHDWTGLEFRRIAPQLLPASLAAHAGWVLLFGGIALLTTGAALLTLRPWSRRFLVAVSTLAALATAAGIAWAAAHRAWPLVAALSPTLMAIVFFWKYLRSPRLRSAFTRHTA